MKRKIKFYRGQRGRQGDLTVTVDGEPLPLYLEIYNHSPTGFECGYSGSGPAQLALALAMDLLKNPRKALACHQDIKRFLVAQLPRNKPWQFDSTLLRDVIHYAEQAKGQQHEH